MPRFIHTADLQLGRQYSRFEPEDSALLAEARFEVISRIAELANEREADAILVAGDVFDMQIVSERNLRRAFELMKAFPGPWLLLPGNHDAALSESVWTRARALATVPENVHLALAPQPIELNEIGLAVLPAPLTQRNTYDDLTAWFDGCDTADDLVRVGLAHGSVSGILQEDVDSANPIDPDRAERANLDYLALGDWHGTRQINTRTWYSGSPETDRFRNNESGNALVIDIAGRGEEPTVETVPVGRFEWIQREVSLAVETDLERLLDELDGVEAHQVIALEVSGVISLEEQERLQQALGKASARCRVLEVKQDALRLHPTEHDIAQLQADGYVGEALAELQSAQDAGDDTAQDALAILAEMLMDARRQDAAREDTA
jgi:DNA repair exonuclease SbcCD nuclease subunit